MPIDFAQISAASPPREFLAPFQPLVRSAGLASPFAPGISADILAGAAKRLSA